MRFRQCDMNDVAEGRECLVRSSPPSTLNEARAPDERHTIVIFCEVLDNLPHDRLTNRRGNYMQTELIPSNTNEQGQSNPSYQEIERPLTDPLLQQCLATHPRHSVHGWYPTIAISLLQHLTSNHCDVWAADFDDLATANGEPLVTDMNGQDHQHYLHTTTKGSSCADILFPTDFGLLARSVRSLDSYSVNVQQQREFLRRYPTIVAKTQLANSWLGSSAYNPMVDDFSNCSVLTLEHDGA